MEEPRSAIDLALRALSFRDRTVAELDARLSEQGVSSAEREEALRALARAGYLDDRRVALARAASLAERGSGDALIRADLTGRGVSSVLADEAIHQLEPEQARAERILEQRGSSAKTARYLASRGFGEDAVEGVVARDTEGAIG